ncbi:MAG: Z1 domain-containing protein [Candidatus Andersenbacteria bacterium]
MPTTIPYLQTALRELDLPQNEAEQAERNAKSIMEAVASVRNTAPENRFGLIYGRIQSGKTRAMIVSTAIAFDEGFKIAIVLTSNINDLVAQTHLNFAAGFPDVIIRTKDDELTSEVESTKIALEYGEGRLLVVCSKGSASLENVIEFMKGIGAKNHDTIIFDDEGDQASLDTQTRRRSQGKPNSEPSKIHYLINDLRKVCKSNVYVSVTGTPQAVLLQSLQARPSFIQLLPPGDPYVGGEQFFNTSTPDDNESHLIRTIPDDEREQLLDEDSPIPSGLRQALLFFLVAAAAAHDKLGQPKENKGYQFLCHPSLKNKEQSIVEDQMRTFVDDIYKKLLTDASKIEEELKVAYNELKKTATDVPALPQLKQTMIRQLGAKKILVINAATKRQGISYGNSINFLIGGNTLGRGIAIPKLLVTYYTRGGRISQMDTMHQHARMFGYRKEELPYTRLFVPRMLYDRFREIYLSDESLRSFIEAHKDSPASFPIEQLQELRPTRPAVLDVNTIEILRPGMQIFPSPIKLPQPQRSYQKVANEIMEIFDVKDLQSAIGKEAQINKEKATALLSMIKTGSGNTWRDKTIGVLLKKIDQHLGGIVNIRFREAERRIDSNRELGSGMLSGAEHAESREKDSPTLWLISATASDESVIEYQGELFIYPTLVVPNSLPKLFIFSNK